MTETEISSITGLQPSEHSPRPRGGSSSPIRSQEICKSHGFGIYRLIRFGITALFFSAGIARAEQCQIVSPLPIPVTFAGCTYSGSLPNNSTSYIQNTLTPTTTGQQSSVQDSSVTYSQTLGFIGGTQCLHSVNGAVSGTGSDCGSGGGGGSWGSITGTLSNQTDLQAKFNGVSTSTNALQAQITATGVSTGSLQSQETATAIATGTLAGFFPVSLTTSVVSGSLLPVANGGTGTASPGLIAGTNITNITGVWPNQTINAATQAGGGGGSSTLAVTTGIIAGWTNVPQSSPTAVVNFDQSQIAVSLQGGATAFVTLQAGIATPTGDYTIGSSVTVVLANCLANCTQTLPTAVGIGGKSFTIKMQSASPVQATVATAGGQTIDGSTTQVLYIQNSALEVISDGSNWQIY